ncbi:MAG: demethylmenaquinone methyltransferase [Actinomycetaceae bacterium]|nr:demethylmenaquinone methyltransferase [Actinomycetaceae bacterium]
MAFKRAFANVKPQIYAADLHKDPHQVAIMFDKVAAKYDITNDVLSLGQDRLWRVWTRRQLNPLPGERILDLAAGTGTSAVEYAKSGAEIVACDFSTGMVAEGKKRHPELMFVAGDATALPFADNTFDAVTISFGLRNVVDTEKGLSEMLRVTKPGGRILVCEFSTPTWGPFRAVYEWYLRVVLTRIAAVVGSNDPAYSYLANSIIDWHDQVELAQIMRSAGWQNPCWKNLTGGIVALHYAIKSGEKTQ